MSNNDPLNPSANQAPDGTASASQTDDKSGQTLDFYAATGVNNPTQDSTQDNQLPNTQNVNDPSQSLVASLQNTDTPGGANASPTPTNSEPSPEQAPVTPGRS